MTENINAELAQVGLLREEIEETLHNAIGTLTSLALEAGNDKARVKRLRQKGDGVRKVLDIYGHKLKTVRKLDEANNLLAGIRAMGIIHTRNAPETEGWNLAVGYIEGYLR